MRRLENWITQILSLTRSGLWSIPYRKGSVLVTLLGVAAVVGVFTGVFAITEGFRKVLQRSADPNCAIVLRAGANNEMVSVLPQEEVRLIGNMPGVVWRKGRPLCSPELFVSVSLRRRRTDLEAIVCLRGVTPLAYQVRRNVHILAGRPFVPGKYEMIVGRSAAAEYEGLEVGAKIRLGKTWWRIVGIFEADGGVEESELWADVHLLQSIYHRGSTYSSAFVRLQNPTAFAQFQKAIESDPRFHVRVSTLQDYYAEQSRILHILITRLGGIITFLMAIGAVFGAVNTMHAAVAARGRELATLRALGFHRPPILVSILLESILLSLVGGLIGGAAAYLLLNGFQTATLNFQSFSQVVFAFDVNAKILAQGLLCAMVVGFIGGLPPAIRAARLPIAMALREL